jgi:hypothetical protein
MMNKMKVASVRWALARYRSHMSASEKSLAKREYRQAWSSMKTALLYLESAARMKERAAALLQQRDREP